jgi:heme/copper-type cytochrome/quinol oxidase subunit 1
MKGRSILIEVFSLAVAFMATMLFCRFVFLWDFRSGTLDLHMHDTYFVLAAETIIVPVFLLMTFIIYFVKEARKRFGRTFPNVILLVTGILLVVLLAYANREFIKTGTSIHGGWTSYPPLSGLTDSVSATLELDPFAALVTNVLTALQIVITLALLFAAFKWGRQVKRR